MPALSPESSGLEKKYVDCLSRHPDQVLTALEDAPIEGFQYFASQEYRQKLNARGNMINDRLSALPKESRPRFFQIFTRMLPKIMKGRRQGFKDAAPDLKLLQQTGKLGYQSQTLMDSFPNQALWETLQAYAWDNWAVLLGFTELPHELIFRNKAVLYRYAIVAIQEMDKEKIDTAPDLDAGEEVLSIYASLGFAVNNIARWLREKHAVRCQANHPLGGLVSDVPLAAKAGLGWMGHNGLLITPQFGQRQRIAPIFVEAPIFPFTDSTDHRWIETYCQRCRRCEKACPTGAIYPEAHIRLDDVPGIGPAKTCIEREKCYPYFNATLGCSICVSVCPFSRANGIYDTLKQKVLGFERLD